MDQNFEKNIFLNFLPPRGAPWGGRGENFQNDFQVYQNALQTILSNFEKKLGKGLDLDLDQIWTSQNMGNDDNPVYVPCQTEGG